MYCVITLKYKIYNVQPENGHYQAPKHVAVPYIENTLYSTNKYSCVRPVHTLCISNYKIKLITNTNADQKNILYNMKHQIFPGHTQTRQFLVITYSRR